MFGLPYFGQGWFGYGPALTPEFREIPDQTAVRNVLLSPASIALMVECVSPSSVLDLDVLAVSSAVDVKVT